MINKLIKKGKTAAEKEKDAKNKKDLFKLKWKLIKVFGLFELRNFIFLDKKAHIKDSSFFIKHDFENDCLRLCWQNFAENRVIHGAEFRKLSDFYYSCKKFAILNVAD